MKGHAIRRHRCKENAGGENGKNKLPCVMVPVVSSRSKLTVSWERKVERDLIAARVDEEIQGPSRACSERRLFCHGHPPQLRAPGSE